MAEDAFQTARFEIYNPSRHKQAMLLSALREYHSMTKQVLESVLADPDFIQSVWGAPTQRAWLAPMDSRRASTLRP